MEFDYARDRTPSPPATWSHVTPADQRGLYSPHAMSEPGCATSSDRHVTDDVMAGARGGSFDLCEMRHYGDTDGVLLVDQTGLLHHEFSPPSPAPQDAISFTPTGAHVDRYFHALFALLAAWRSGNGVGRINEVTLYRAWLVLGWVTCLCSTPGGGTLFRYVTSRPGRLSLSSFRGR